MSFNPSTDNVRVTGSIRFRVLAASTGTCYPITLHPNELSVANIRQHLAQYHTLPKEDQILLLGPPYKVPKDSVLRTNETLAALRLGDEEDGVDGSIYYDSSSGSTTQMSQMSQTYPLSAQYTQTTHSAQMAATIQGIQVNHINQIQKRHVLPLGPTEKTGSKRLFLFSKRALSENAPDPPICTLDPIPSSTLTPPMQIDNRAYTDLLDNASSNSPLRKALQVYLHQIHTDLSTGRTLVTHPALGSIQLLTTSRTLLVEQGIIVQALRAAVSNLADHRAGAAREWKMFGEEFKRVERGNEGLLKAFHSRLATTGCGATAGIPSVVATNSTTAPDQSQSLESIPLHPSLVTTARSAGRVMESLLDVVPLDRERAWANKCRLAHERLSISFQELDAAFGLTFGSVGSCGTMGSIGVSKSTASTTVSTSSWNEEIEGDLAAEEMVKSLFMEVEDIGVRVCNEQQQKLAVLMGNHEEASRIVNSTLDANGASAGGEGSVETAGDAGDEEDATDAEKPGTRQSAKAPTTPPNSAFSSLESLSQSTTTTVQAVQSNHKTLHSLATRIIQSKTSAMKRMKLRLRQISVAQSSIARSNSSVSVLRHALAQQMADLEHLQHVVELPNSYAEFLKEVSRRRMYYSAFLSNVNALSERLEMMREEELKLREGFLRGAGRHLMPAFFEIFAPTLATEPPVFEIGVLDVAELESLPNVGEEELHQRQSQRPQQVPQHSQQGQSGQSGQAGFSSSLESDNMISERDGVPANSAAALTDCPSLRHDPAPTSFQKSDMEIEPSSEKEMTTDDQQKSKDISCHLGNPSLIVSACADEQSGHDVIMKGTSSIGGGDSRGSRGSRGSNMQQEESSAHSKRILQEEAETKADNATLHYENAVLRQLLERAGVKPTPSYLDSQKTNLVGVGHQNWLEQQAKEKDKRLSHLEVELARIKSELETSNREAVQMKQSIKEQEKQSKEQKDQKEPKHQLNTDQSYSQQDDKISHSSFQIGNVCLFMPTGRGREGKRTYLAFHSNCPHRYLSSDCIAGSPDFVLGRIVFQEEMIAGKVDTKENPFGLHPGTKFWVLTVEILRKG